MEALNSAFGNGPGDIQSPVPDSNAESSVPQGAPVKLQAHEEAQRAPAAEAAQPSADYGDYGTPSTTSAPPPATSAPQVSAPAGSEIGDYGDVLRDAPVNTNPYSGKKVTAQIPFLGTLQVDENGKAYVIGKKKKVEVNQDLQEFYKSFYDLYKSIPSTVGMTGGLAASMLMPGGGVVGGAARTAFAAGLGGATGAGLSNNGKPSPKEYALAKAAGLSDEEIFGSKTMNDAISAGAASALGQGVGEATSGLVGHYIDRKAKEASTLAIQQEHMEIAKSLQDSAKALGIDLSDVQATRGLPGFQGLTNKELAIMKGMAGPDQQAALQDIQAKQREQWANSFQTQLGRIANGVDFANLDTQKLSGPDQKTFIDRILQNKINRLKTLRQPIEDIAGSSQLVDPTHLYASMKSSLEKYYGGTPNLFDDKGFVNLDALRNVSKQTGSSDRAFNLFVGDFARLQNMIRRDSGAFAYRNQFLSPDAMSPSQLQGTGAPPSNPPATRLMPPNEAGAAQAGLTFKQIYNITDSLQDAAFSDLANGSKFFSALREAAFNAKQAESDAAQAIALRGNNPDLANAYDRAKKDFQDAAFAHQRLNKMITSNLDTAADTIFSQGKSAVNMVQSVASEKQMREIRGSVLQKVYFDAIDKSHGDAFTSGIDPSAVKNYLFGNKKAAEATDALFGEDSKVLKSLANIAEAIQPGTTYGGSQEELAKGQRFVNLLGQLSKTSIAKASSFLEAMLGHNVSVQDMVKQELPTVMAENAARLNSYSKKIKRAEVVDTLVKGVRTGLPFIKPSFKAGQGVSNAPSDDQ